MLTFKILVLFVFIFPAAFIDAWIYLLGGWTLPDYQRPSLVHKLIAWVEK